MREILKKILHRSPLPLRRFTVFSREQWNRFRMTRFEHYQYPYLPKLRRDRGPIKNILIYHISGLSHAGTEKNLQLLANGLCDEFEVVFMFGKKYAEKDREILLDSRITLVPFTYDAIDINVPHEMSGMQPHLKEILSIHNTDLIITASPGYSHYPWNVITEIPIILSNVFGAPANQNNIVATMFMSKTVQKHAEHWTGPSLKNHTRFLPIGKWPPDNTSDLATKLRASLNIHKDDFVFGRIGRDDDAIFDPICIRAWQHIAKDHLNAHLLVMSSPPVLTKIVERENIPRVHFLPKSGNEEAVWAFHGAIDCFAHFRRDGETSGVAIAESLTLGNPIISHRSKIWNAHLEYLSQDFARVADIDDVNMYAKFMHEFISLKYTEPRKWRHYREAAFACATKTSRRKSM